MYYIISILLIIWICGWIGSILETSVSQDHGFKKLKGIILLFFIWPYIAYCIANQGDI